MIAHQALSGVLPIHPLVLPWTVRCDRLHWQQPFLARMARPVRVQMTAAPLLSNLQILNQSSTQQRQPMSQTGSPSRTRLELISLPPLTLKVNTAPCVGNNRSEPHFIAEQASTPWRRSQEEFATCASDAAYLALRLRCLLPFLSRYRYPLHPPSEAMICFGGW